uniref:Reverse transcriptase zinc-binding domain-containing protein n=1 Tax=Fagus sylvatica TaxID=28930 RepID=A0A2N9HAI3_FAGSY
MVWRPWLNGSPTFQNNANVVTGQTTVNPNHDQVSIHSCNSESQLSLIPSLIPTSSTTCQPISEVIEEVGEVDRSWGSSRDWFIDLRDGRRLRIPVDLRSLILDMCWTDDVITQKLIHWVSSQREAIESDDDMEVSVGGMLGLEDGSDSVSALSEYGVADSLERNEKELSMGELLVPDGVIDGVGDAGQKDLVPLNVEPLAVAFPVGVENHGIGVENHGSKDDGSLVSQPSDWVQRRQKAIGKVLGASYESYEQAVTVLLKDIEARHLQQKATMAGFVDWMFLGSSGASRGILLMWNSRVVEKLEGAVGYFSVSYKFKNVEDHHVWMFSGVYGLNIDRDRRLMWDELAGIRSWWDVPWCLGGDFNVVRFPLERVGSSNFSPSMHDFSDFISSNELIDIPLTGGDFTWSNNREVSSLSRIDRFLYSADWVEDYINILQKREDGYRRPYLEIQFAAISDEDALWLQQPFEENEIEIVVEFHEYCQFERSLNATFVSLIPKKHGADELKDFRPISLVGGMYKIIAKLLANRLTVVLEKIISPPQSVFVKCRQILDSVLITNECLDSRLKASLPGVLCKLDLEKAYDHCVELLRALKDFIHPLSPRSFRKNWSYGLFVSLVQGYCTGMLSGFSVGSLDSAPLEVKSKAIWNPIIEKMERCLAGWKRIYLSKGADVATRIKKIQRNFLWGTSEEVAKIHLVKWDMMCSPYSHGSLAIKNLRRFNESLLGKWLWRFGVEREAFWRKVIMVKYESLEGGWMSKAPNGPHGVGLWKFIRSRWAKFSKFVAFDLAYPELYRIACVKDALVADFVQVRGHVVHWEVTFTRLAQDWELESISSFFELLYSANIISTKKDKMCWKPARSKGFQVKSFYTQPTSSGLGFFPWKSIWKAKVPPRVAFFVWTAALWKILIADNLCRRGIIVVSWCYMCKTDGEFVNHLLLHCPYAKELWDMIFGLFGL